MEVSNKFCSKCSVSKPLNDFRKNRSTLRTECKACEKNYRQGRKEQSNQHERNRRKNEPNYRLTCNIRSRLYNALKSQQASKNEHTFDLVSCSIHQLNKWLNFTKPFYIPDGYTGKLHVDHFYPLSKFDLNDPDQLKEACNWSNLRYLSAEQNLKKSNNLPSPCDKFKMLMLKYMFEKI